MSHIRFIIKHFENTLEPIRFKNQYFHFKSFSKFNISKLEHLTHESH